MTKDLENEVLDGKNRAFLDANPFEVLRDYGVSDVEIQDLTAGAIRAEKRLGELEENRLREIGKEKVERRNYLKDFVKNSIEKVGILVGAASLIAGVSAGVYLLQNKDFEKFDNSHDKVALHLDGGWNVFGMSELDKRRLASFDKKGFVESLNKVGISKEEFLRLKDLSFVDDSLFSDRVLIGGSLFRFSICPR